MTQSPDDQLFQIALAHHQQGRIAEAQAAYRRLLSQQPNHPEALRLLGVLLGTQGHHDQAIVCFQQALALRPAEPTYHHNLGFALQTKGRFEEAARFFREAARLQPDFAAAHFSLAVSLHALGRADQAIDSYRRALQFAPDQPETHCNLGVVLRMNGQLNEAITSLRQAVRLNPALGVAHQHLGRSLSAAGHLDEAIACFRRAIQLMPASADVYNDLGIALQSKGLRDEAIAHYRSAVQLQPNFAEAHQNLGNLLREKGALEEAIASLSRAIQIKPDLAEAHYNLGYALQEGGQMDAAMDSYLTALQLNPAHAAAHNNFAFCLKARGRLDEAIASYRQALRLNPAFAQAHNNLGLALDDAAAHGEGLEHHRQAVAFEPANPIVHSNLIFALQYHPDTSAPAILEECRQWNRRHAAPFTSRMQPHINDRDPTRRLRIGYVSPDLRLHPAALNLLPLFSAHDHSQFEIFCYSGNQRPDAVTAALRRGVDQWRETAGQSHEQLAQIVRQDRIDILVDLALHSAHGNLLLFARKPAPVQVTFAGYPGTTGVAAIDYRLTDPHLDPPAAHDEFYSEQSVRLPDSFWCYDPFTQEPAVDALPASANGHITFGCLGNFSKINPRVLTLWARVLHAVPHSRLLLLAPQGHVRPRVLSQLADEGIASDRVEFADRLARAEYLKIYHRFDIGLDTLPYNGHTTSLDSYWMGVPVVTLVGPTIVGRAGLSQLMNLGLPELVAQSPDRFIQIAAALAADLPRLAMLRSTLRQRMEKSPLMDGPRFARGLEAAYRRMWSTWCAAPR